MINSLARKTAATCLLALTVGCTQPFNPHQVHEALPVSGWERAFEEQLHARLLGPETVDVLAAYQRRSGEQQVFEDIILSNDTVLPGENRLVAAVRFVRNRREVPLELETGGNYSFRPDDIDRALRAWLDGVKVDRSPRARKNRYGSYHFVSGEARDGSQCVFAWQLLRHDRAALPEGVQDVALQLRYCASEDQPEDMIRLFDTVALSN